MIPTPRPGNNAGAETRTQESWLCPPAPVAPHTPRLGIQQQCRLQSHLQATTCPLPSSLFPSQARQRAPGSCYLLQKAAAWRGHHQPALARGATGREELTGISVPCPVQAEPPSPSRLPLPRGAVHRGGMENPAPGPREDAGSLNRKFESCQAPLGCPMQRHGKRAPPSDLCRPASFETARRLQRSSQHGAPPPRSRPLPQRASIERDKGQEGKLSHKGEGTWLGPAAEPRTPGSLAST